MNQQAVPYVLAAGQARSHPGSFPAIKAGAADTGGLFTFCEGVLGPRTPGSARHVHYGTDETFYVIDGQRSSTISCPPLRGARDLQTVGLASVRSNPALAITYGNDP